MIFPQQLQPALTALVFAQIFHSYAAFLFAPGNG
jgi:hypothetical protein